MAVSPEHTLPATEEELLKGLERFVADDENRKAAEYVADVLRRRRGVETEPVSAEQVVENPRDVVRRQLEEAVHRREDEKFEK